MKTFSNSLIFLTFLTAIVLSFGTASQATPSSDTKVAEEHSHNSQVNINTADAETIAASLRGVGLSKAQAIVAYRKSYGEFEYIEELTSVKGIGKGTLVKNAHLIKLE